MLLLQRLLIHGGGPFSADRFALIGHTSRPRRNRWRFYPLLRMDGTRVGLGISERRGPCGRWVDEDGEVVELFDPAAPEGRSTNREAR